jgi:hypothetical protein
MLCISFPDWLQYRHAEQTPTMWTRSLGVGVPAGGEDRSEDDDADYQSMERDPELMEDEAVARTMAIFQAIHVSQRAPPPPSPHAPENLPSRPSAASVWPPQVFIDLGDED